MFRELQLNYSAFNPKDFISELSFLRFKKYCSTIQDADYGLVYPFNPSSTTKENFFKELEIFQDKPIVVDYSFENIDKQTYSWLEESGRKFKIYTNSIFTEPKYSEYDHIKIDYSKIHIERFFLNYRNKYFCDGQIQTTTSKLKKPFLYMVGKNRPHRILLLQKIIEQGLLESGYISYFLTSNYNFDKQFNIDLNFLNNLPKKLELDVDKFTPEVSHSIYFNREYYDLVDFVVVAETEIDKGRMFFTEKIAKCIILNKPFILLSSPNSISTLKTYCRNELELDISHLTDWIDTSYDKEKNLEKRILMIVDQIQKQVNIYNKNKTLKTFI